MADHLKKYLPWFTLKAIPFLGNVTFKKLITRFHSAECILSATPEELKTISGITGKAIQGIDSQKKYRDQVKPEVKTLLKNHIKIAVYTDPEYPSMLRQINDPPPFITYRGTLNISAPCISIVGSRNATSYGLSTARYLAGRLAQKGFQIVSGMARGIDTSAHIGAIEAGGTTIAVLGSGLGHIYPRENLSLSNTIASCGAVVSEFNFQEQPEARNFPVRNRIIAGLSCGTVVVEAAKKSGSLITARLAGDYNREVFAVPGSIKSRKSEGTHHLLKQGARLVESEMDIVDELHQFVHIEKKEKRNALQSKKAAHVNSLEKSRQVILNILEPYPIHIDEIIKKSGMDSSTISSQLLDLELDNIVNRHQGNYYSISEAPIE
jgi:DNA processing protein